jgi:methionine synthase II (cobalamin-independent)
MGLEKRMITPHCRPILIGSLPLTNHAEALQLILTSTPEIPLWPQLPKNPHEGMIRQFLTGFPGLIDDGKDYRIDTDSLGFAEEMAAFYGEYLQAVDDPAFLKTSRFALGRDSATGFFTLLAYLAAEKTPPFTVKGQVTGPVTTGIGMKDGSGNSIFYDDNLRDILIKLLALKACWQVAELQRFTGTAQPIIFIDEPGLVSFGSSGFVGVSREMASLAVSEVIAAIQGVGGLAGVHICANGDWGPVLTSETDIISFDAYSYFDNFILYKDQLCGFLSRGGILAWGIVPTGDPLAIAEESASSLFSKWLAQLERLATFGFSKQQLMAQTFIAPSCGTGSLSIELAEKVLALTAELSQMARAHLLHQSHQGLYR